MSKTPWEIVRLPCVRSSDKHGLLTIAEPAKIAPGFFPGDAAVRVYMISNDSDGPIARGGHFHPAGGKREILVAARGFLSFELHSAGICGRITLDDAKHAILIPNEVWHGVLLGPGALLLSIASTLYAPNESVAAKPCGCP